MIDFSISKLNLAKNWHTAFVVFSIIFITVCLILSMINTYKLGECRTGRSKGKLRPICYTDLYCTPPAKEQAYVSLNVGISPVPSTIETLTFPKTNLSTSFQMNINYNEVLPSGGISFFGDSQLGICAADDTIYLGSISAFNGLEETYDFNTKTAAIIKHYLAKQQSEVNLISQDDGNLGTQNSIAYYINTANTTDIEVTSNMDGIFGISPYGFVYNPGEGTGPVNAREYYFDVSRQAYLNTISPNASNKIISCVDPSIIFPCGERVYNPTENKWCDSKTSSENCVSFCAPYTDSTAANQQGAASINSGINSGTDSKLFYQTNIVSNASIRDALKPSFIKKNQTDFPYKQGGKNLTDSEKSAGSSGVYLDHLVFCGGLGSASGNSIHPLSSNRPNAVVSSTKMNLGF